MTITITDANIQSLSNRKGRSIRASTHTIRKSWPTKCMAVGWVTVHEETAICIVGGGLIQLTGKAEYLAVTTSIRAKFPGNAPDLVASPDDAIGADWCVAAAAAVWDGKGGNALADEDLIKPITRRINGGYVGLAQREEWLRRTKAIWH